MTVSLTRRRAIVAPGTVITASGSSGPMAIDVDTVAALNLYASITAISGTTPSVTFGIEFDADTAPATYPPAAWGTATNGAAQTGTGSDVAVVSATGATQATDGLTVTRYYRVVWTVSGTTPSITLGALYTDN